MENYNHNIWPINVMRVFGVFPKSNRNSLNSLNSWNQINHVSMNWAQFKDPVSHMFLAGSVVASWSIFLIEFSENI